MEFKNSKTEQNLRDAFAGESMARMKYDFWASKARKDGYEQIGAFFEESAGNEREHAKIWFKMINNGQISDTKSNLASAAAGEHAEWTDMYKRMADEARAEGFVDIAAQFEKVGAIEKHHEERFAALLENINKGVVFARKSKQIWICRNCGHVIDAKESPQCCPTCAHPQAYFEIKSINY